MEETELITLSMDGIDLSTSEPTYDRGLGGVSSCEGTNPAHRRDVNTTPPTHRTTLRKELSPINKLVKCGRGRNPTSRASASPNISGPTGNVNFTRTLKERTSLTCSL